MTSMPNTARLRAAGIEFTQPPTDDGTGVSAIFDDTCGNLIAIVTPEPPPEDLQS